MRDLIQTLVQRLFRSLSTRIAVFLFLLSFCSVVVLSAALYHAYARLVSRSTSAKLEAICNVCVDRLRHWAYEKKNDLAYLSQGLRDCAITADESSYRTYLQRYVTTHPDTRSIVLLNAQGKVAHASVSDAVLPRGMDWSGTEIFRQVRTRATFCTSVVPSVHGSNAGFMLMLAVPVCIPAAQDIAVMALEIDTPFLSGLFRGSAGLFDSGDELVIVDAASRSLNPLHWSNGVQRTLSVRMAGGTGVVKGTAPVGHQGIDYAGHAVFTAADRVPDLNWDVIVNRPLAHIEKERRDAWLTGLALLPLVLLVLAVISILLARSITGPLHKICSVVERFHRGDLSARIKLGRNDEIGTLAAMIDATTTGVQSKIDQLFKLERALICERDNLEQVIADRTAVLRTREEQFKTIADYTVNWELWLSPTGRLIWTNKICYTLTGYTVDEFLATPDFWQLVSAQVTTPQFLEHFKGALRGEIGRGVEFCCRHKNGARFWVSASWGPVYNDEHQFLGIRASVEDVTHVRRVRLDLEQMAKAMDYAADGMVIASADGTILYVNRACENICGYSREEMLGKSIDCFYNDNGENREAVGAFMAAMVRGLQWSGNVYNRRKDGTPYVMAATASPIMNSEGKLEYFISNRRDITEMLRKQLQRQRLAQVVEQSSVGIAIADCGGRIDYVNQRFCTMLGLLPDAVVGRPLRDFYADGALPQDGDVSVEEIERLRVRGAVWNGTVRRRHASGRSLVTTTSVFPILDDAKKSVSYVLANQDVTDIVAHEDEILVLQESLKQSIDAILIVNNQARIVFANEAFYTLFNVPTIPCNAASFTDVMQAAHVTLPDSVVTECLAHGHVWRGTTHGVDKQGNTRSVELFVSPIFDKRGGIVNSVISIRDITQEAKLREQNHCLAQVVLQSRDAIVIYDSGLHLVYANDAFLTMFGVRRDDVIGQTVEEFYQSSSLTEQAVRAGCAIMASIDRQESWKGPVQNQRRDGVRFTTQTTVYPVHNHEGAVVNYVEIKSDITEQLRYQERARRLSHVVEQSSIPIIVADGTGLILYLNNTYTELMGFSKEELLGRRLADTYADHTRYAVIKTALDNEGVWHGQSPALRKDQSSFIREDFLYTIKDEEGALAYIAVNCWDVTQEREVQNEVNRLAQVIEQSTDAIMIVTVEGKIIYVNNQYMAMFGYAKEELVAHRLDDLSCGELPRAFNAALVQRMQAGKSWCGRLENGRKDGVSITVDVNLSPIYSCANVLAYYVVQQRDATRLIELEMQV